MKATRKQLEDFVRHVAYDNAHRLVLAAQARDLLNAPPVPFDPDTLLSSVDITEKDNDELMSTLEALCIEYGSQPIDYILQTVRVNTLTEHMLSILIPLGRMKHDESRNARRLILEEILLSDLSYRHRYYALLALSYMDDIASIEAVQTLIDSDCVESLKKDGRQLLDQLTRTVRRTYESNS